VAKACGFGFAVKQDNAKCQMTAKDKGTGRLSLRSASIRLSDFDVNLKFPL
jgi:hypothetical protein